jgi:hypothetical protein
MAWLGLAAFAALIGESRGADRASIVDNRGLITYYTYVRPERVRQEVQEIERQRQQSRDSLHQVQTELDWLEQSLQNSPNRRGAPVTRGGDERASDRLRAATFARRTPYYPF